MVGSSSLGKEHAWRAKTCAYAFAQTVVGACSGTSRSWHRGAPCPRTVQRLRLVTTTTSGFLSRTRTTEIGKLELCSGTAISLNPLGGVKKTAKWTYAVVDGEFSMNPKGDGFSLTMEI